MPKQEKLCVHCKEAPIVPGRRKYCGDDCSKASMRLKARATAKATSIRRHGEKSLTFPRNCEICGEWFIPKSATAKYCSKCRQERIKEQQNARTRRLAQERRDAPKKIIPPRLCAECRKLFYPKRTNQKYCEPGGRCWRNATNKQQNKKRPHVISPPRDCRGCGKTITPSGQDQHNRKYCNSCMVQGVTNRRTPLPAKKRATAIDMCGNRCCKCGVKTTGQGQDDNAPAIDHIIPRNPDKGNGTDLYNNLQLLCWKCNSEKGDRHTADYRTPEQKHALELLAIEEEENIIFTGRGKLIILPTLKTCAGCGEPFREKGTNAVYCKACRGRDGKNRRKKERRAATRERPICELCKKEYKRRGSNQQYCRQCAPKAKADRIAAQQAKQRKIRAESPPPSDEAKARASANRSAAQKKRFSDPEEIRKASARSTGRKHSPQTNHLISENSKKMWERRKAANG